MPCQKSGSFPLSGPLCRQADHHWEILHFTTDARKALMHVVASAHRLLLLIFERKIT
jgi:hypothetical protein